MHRHNVDSTDKRCIPVLSMGWVGWVGSTVAKVLKICTKIVNAFKERTVKNMNKLMLG